MASSFEELLKNRKKTNDSLNKKVESLKKGGSYDKEPDARLWDLKHLKNDDGNGRATIRFLPAPLGEDEPFVQYFSYFHQNKKNGKWYVEKSLKTFGNDEKDPAYDYNGTIYDNQAIAKDDKSKHTIRRNKTYVSNILVVDDPKNPDNNGKVFLFEYGPMIFKMIEARMNPDPNVSDDEPAIPFDPIEGCNFKIKIVSKKLNGNLTPNYESSTWGPISPLADDAEEMEKIWKKAYPLAKEFLDRSKYNPYEKQLENFKRVFGFIPGGTIPEDKQEQESKPAAEVKEKQAPLAEVEDDDDNLPWTKDEDETPAVSTASSAASDDEDDDDDFFARFKG